MNKFLNFTKKWRKNLWMKSAEWYGRKRDEQRKPFASIKKPLIFIDKSKKQSEIKMHSSEMHRFIHSIQSYSHLSFLWELMIFLMFVPFRNVGSFFSSFVLLQRKRYEICRAQCHYHSLGLTHHLVS